MISELCERILERPLSAAAPVQFAWFVRLAKAGLVECGSSCVLQGEGEGMGEGKGTKLARGLPRS